MIMVNSDGGVKGMEVTSKAMHGKRDRIEVIIYTQTHKIVGTMHTMPASRLVDFINAKTADLFVAVTHAKVYSLPDEKLLQTTDFLAINKKEIVMVFPKAPGPTPH
jgi:hypothetical protein